MLFGSLGCLHTFDCCNHLEIRAAHQPRLMSPHHMLDNVKLAAVIVTSHVRVSVWTGGQPRLTPCFYTSAFVWPFSTFTHTHEICSIIVSHRVTFMWWWVKAHRCNVLVTRFDTLFCPLVTPDHSVIAFSWLAAHCLKEEVAIFFTNVPLFLNLLSKLKISLPQSVIWGHLSTLSKILSSVGAGYRKYSIFTGVGHADWFCWCLQLLNWRMTSWAINSTLKAPLTSTMTSKRPIIPVLPHDVHARLSLHMKILQTEKQSLFFPSLSFTTSRALFLLKLSADGCHFPIECCPVADWFTLSACIP